MKFRDAFIMALRDIIDGFKGIGRIAEDYKAKKHIIDFTKKEKKDMKKNPKQYRNTFAAKEIQLDPIQEENFESFINWRGGLFKGINPGQDYFNPETQDFSDPRKVLLQNGDQRYIFNDPDENGGYNQYIIANGSFVDSQGNKGTDTIICVNENQYYRIRSDNSYIRYESYIREGFQWKRLAIRKPINVGKKEYIHYQGTEEQRESEYFFEEQDDGRCIITIKGNFVFDYRIILTYKSKQEMMNGGTPIKVYMKNNLNVVQFDKDETDEKERYTKKSIIGLTEDKDSLGNRKVSYDRMVRSCREEMRLINFDIVNPQVIRQEIQADIPDRVLEIYYTQQPDIAMKIDSSVQNRILQPQNGESGERAIQEREEEVYTGEGTGIRS